MRFVRCCHSSFFNSFVHSFILSIAFCLRCSFLAAPGNTADVKWWFSFSVRILMLMGIGHQSFGTFLPRRFYMVLSRAWTWLKRYKLKKKTVQSLEWFTMISNNSEKVTKMRIDSLLIGIRHLESDVLDFILSQRDSRRFIIFLGFEIHEDWKWFIKMQWLHF